MKAGDVIRKLSRDKEYVAMRNKRRAERQEQKAQLLEEQKELNADLASVGIEVETVWDLVNSSDPYPEAIGVLANHLDRTSYSNGTLEGIARALTCKEAKGIANDTLLRLLHETDNDNLRWVVGNTLSVTATENELEEILDILQTRKYGDARSALPVGLLRIMGSDAVPILKILVDDRQLTAEVLVALGHSKDIGARATVERFLDDEDSWIRGKARAAVKKLRS